MITRNWVTHIPFSDGPESEQHYLDRLHSHPLRNQNVNWFVNAQNEFASNSARWMVGGTQNWAKVHVITFNTV